MKLNTVLFSRIIGKIKANKVLKEYNVKMIPTSELEKMLDHDGNLSVNETTVYGIKTVIMAHPDDMFVAITNVVEVDEDFDYEYWFEHNNPYRKLVQCMSIKTGFTDIDFQTGISEV